MADRLSFLKSGLQASIVQLFLLLGMSLMCAHSVLADTQRELPTSDKAHTDAVLLLDASGSMRATDPDRLRDEGARLFLQFLQKGDRLAVVEFAEKAREIRELSSFSSVNVDKLTSELAKVGDEGLYTDILGGLKKAESILTESIREDGSAIIILLSDGKHDPDPSQREVKESLELLMDEVLPRLSEKGIKVYTLAFSEQVDKDLLAKIAETTDALSWYTPTADDIHQSFADLFLAVKKPQIVPLTSKGFKIDEGITEATFYINNDDGNSNLVIRAPDGKSFRRDQPTSEIKWFKGKKFDVVTIPQPQVGNWQLIGLPSKEAFATVLTDLKLVTDFDGNITAESQSLIQARLYEAEKPVVLPEMSGVTKYLLQIIPIDRVSEPVVRAIMTDDGKHGDRIAGDGIFSVPISLERPGEYKLKILARTPTFERSQQIPFQVKKRIITLSVVSEAGGEAHSQGGEHGDDHSHGNDQDHSDEHDHGDQEHGEDASKPDSSSDVFRIELSPDVASFKTLELKFVAIDETRKTYRLPLSHVSPKTLIYQLPTSVLPHDGKFELSVSLSAKDRKRSKVSAKSNSVEYTRVTTGKHGEAEVVVVEHHEEPVAKKGESPPLIPAALIIVVINLLAGGVCALLLKKSQSTLAFHVPAFEPSSDLLAAISELENRSQETEISLDDPVFQMDAGSLPARSETARRDASEQTEAAEEEEALEGAEDVAEEAEVPEEELEEPEEAVEEESEAEDGESDGDEEEESV